MTTGVTLKPLLALLLAAVSVLAGTAGAVSPFYYYDERLSRIARETLWQSAGEGAAIRRGEVLSVGVRCYRDKQAFERSFESRTRASAARVIAYYAGGRDVHLRHTTCANVHFFFEGRSTMLTAGAYAILLHEALHRQGIAHERFATCFANESVRWGALWFGSSEAKALRARNLAFTYTRLYAPRSYRMGKPNCLAMSRKTEWVDLT